MVVVGRGFFIDKFGKLVRHTPGVSSLITLNSNTTFLCDAIVLFVVAIGVGSNSSVNTRSLVRDNFCCRSTTVVLALVAINGALRSCSGKGAASTVGDLVGLTPSATAIVQGKRRMAIGTRSIQINSRFVIGTKRDVPISNIVVGNSTTISRSTLANRDIPISGTRNSGISTTAVGRSNFVGYHTISINRSATLTGVVRVISSTSTAGTPVTGVTSGISNIFIPTIVTVSVTAVVK